MEKYVQLMVSLKSKSTNGFNVKTRSQEQGVKPMQDDDISFIVKLGMQAFDEEVQAQKVMEMCG